MEISDFTSYLKNYDPPHGFQQPDSEGLAESLKEVVLESPSFFTNSFNQFLDILWLLYSHLSAALTVS